MNEDTVLIVDDLSKKFCTDLKRIMVYGVQDVTRDWFGMRYDRALLRPSEFWSLKDVSFELKRGETLGVIGRNGAGKSTLLRLLNGIYPPDRGRIEVHGRIAALIAIGAGFHPHLTGRENIFLNGTILGMTRTDIKHRLDEIVDFAGIGQFIDSPVATYSSGMNVRLGFAIAVHAPIEILLADEVLAVGDLAFRVKCYEKIGQLREKGISTLFVSHEMTNVSVYCNKALVLDKGNVRYCGDVEEGISIYLKDYLPEMGSSGGIEKPINGTKDFVIRDVHFEPGMINDQIDLIQGQDLALVVDYTAMLDFPNVAVGNILYPPFPSAQPVFAAFSGNNASEKLTIRKGNGRLRAVIKNINANNIKLFYNFSITLNNRSTYGLWWKRVPVLVSGNSLSSGFMHFDTQCMVEAQND